VTDRVQLANQLSWIANHLEGLEYPFHGPVRQAAQHLKVETPEEPTEARPDACRRCHTPLVQKPTGRPRRYCSDRCRKGRTKPGGK
jgi:hypothetical protein